MSEINSKIPQGPLAEKWTNYKNHQKLVNPANKRRLDVIVVGTGLAGASAAASLAEMMIKVLPEIAGKIAEPLSQIDKITIIGGGSEDNGIGSVAGNVPVVMAKLFESMKEATGVDLSEIMRADTYDAKVNRNIQISSPEELKEYLKAEAGKAAADAESPEKAEASEPVQKDGSEQ